MIEKLTGSMWGLIIMGCGVSACSIEDLPSSRGANAGAPNNGGNAGALASGGSTSGGSVASGGSTSGSGGTGGSGTGGDGSRLCVFGQSKLGACSLK